ncbi:MAG TPA: OmpA family protein [Lysobacter sp.]
MKDKPSEWIAISDLMAGVMAVVMLLLVVSVLQKSYAELKHRQAMAERRDPRQAAVRKMIDDLRGSLQDALDDGMVAVDVDGRTITLRDGVFQRGSACVAGQSTAAFAQIQTQLASFLARFPEGRVYVEGHTDDRPVARPVTDYAKFCTVYDDNFTLSAARAREARKLLTSDWQGATSQRVVVAGFGDSQPLAGIPAGDSRQRRIEVRLVLPERRAHPL